MEGDRPPEPRMYVRGFNAPWCGPAAAAAFLVLLTVSAHFALAGRFGFYEDDYAFAAPTMDWTAGQAWAWVRLAIGRGGQGRPVGFIIGAVGPWIGYHLAGRHVVGMYAVAAAVESANAVLFFALLRRAAFPRPVPLLAAIALVLYPADTTQPFLCHALVLQPAVTLLLVALHLYVSGSRWRRWSYAAVTASLLCYETAILPFLAAPLLVPGVWNRRLPGRWARHAGVLVVILTVAFVVRRIGGEARATGDVPDHLLRRVSTGCVSGPVVALRQCGLRLVDTTGVAVLAAVPLVAAVALAGRRRAGVPGVAVARLVGCGAAMTALAYGLSFTHDVTVTAGRLTSVHMAAAPGVALLLAAAAVGVLAVGRRLLLYYPACALLGGYLSMLFGFAWHVQLGYAADWSAERAFWSRVVRLCPDATPGTAVLLRGRVPPESDVALVKSWADFRVWDELFALPKVGPPRLVDFDGWPDRVRWAAGAVRWDRLPPPRYGLVDGLPIGRAVLLEAHDYQVERVGGTITLAGHAVPLNPPVPAGVAAYPRRPLFRLLVGADGGG